MIDITVISPERFWFISSIHPFRSALYSRLWGSVCFEILVAFKLLTAAKNIFRTMWCILYSVNKSENGGNLRFDGLSHTCLLHHPHPGWADQNFPHLPRPPGLLWRHGRQWDRKRCLWTESLVSPHNFNHMCSRHEKLDPMNSKVFKTFLRREIQLITSRNYNSDKVDIICRFYLQT